MLEPRSSGLFSTRFIERHWLRDSCLSRALLPIAWLHGGVLTLRRMLYRCGCCASRSVHVPVMMVGNFFVGGTGKTPLVVALAALLCHSGRVPGIVSRGFGSANVRPRPVRPGDHPDRVGDEPLLIAERSHVPVWIGRDRVATARALLSEHTSVDVIICDDGLQHLALRRDIEIAVFDARGAGNGRLLPAGPLRERPRRVDAVVCNGGGTHPGQFAMTIEPAGFYRLDDSASRVDASSLQRMRTVAIAGIGDPQRFFRTLATLDLQPLRTVAFPDHHRFALADLRFPDCDAIVMTEKDAVKCRSLGSPIPLYALRVDAKIDASFEALILSLLRSVSSHGRAST